MAKHNYKNKCPFCNKEWTAMEAYEKNGKEKRGD